MTNAQSDNAEEKIGLLSGKIRTIYITRKSYNYEKRERVEAYIGY